MTLLRLPVVADLDTLSSLMLTAALEEAVFQVLIKLIGMTMGGITPYFQA